MKKTPVRDIFFPQRCCGCDTLTQDDSPFCKSCKKLVIPYKSTNSECDICGFRIDKCICEKRRFYTSFTTVFYHEDNARKNIFRLKFHSRPDIAENFSKALILQLNEREVLSNTDIITFVPMRRFAKLKRGYNQSELLAKQLSRNTGIECLPLLTKEFRTRNQHTLGKIARSTNLLGAFEVKKEQAEYIIEKNILIVDDVFTTGSTMNEIAKTLLIFGADKIFAASCTLTRKKQLNQSKYYVNMDP